MEWEFDGKSGCPWKEGIASRIGKGIREEIKKGKGKSKKSECQASPYLSSEKAQGTPSDPELKRGVKNEGKDRIEVRAIRPTWTRRVRRK